MPKAIDFRVTRCQCSIFAPGLATNRTKALAFLLSEYGDQFDGDPITLPNFPSQVDDVTLAAFEDMPSFLLKSGDGKLLLQAARNRLDIILESDPIPDLTAHLTWVSSLVSAYLKKNKTDASRVACVLNKLIDSGNPSRVLADHFCKDQWLNDALKRPQDFQLHAMKRFLLPNLFEINSWIRCKAAALSRERQVRIDELNAILVEQDFNTLVENSSGTRLAKDQIRKFFLAVPGEMNKVMELYFPSE